MPRRGRGGRREGTAGKLYENRTDLAMNDGTAGFAPDSVRPYGTGTSADELSQARRPGSATGPATGSGPAPSGPPIPPPGSLTSLNAATERPDEPMLTGLDRPSTAVEDPDELLRALYMAFPSEDIRELLEMRGLQ